MEVSITKKYFQFYNNETGLTQFVNPTDLKVIKEFKNLKTYSSPSDDLILIMSRDNAQFFVNDLNSGEEKTFETGYEGCEIQRSHMTAENIEADFSKILVALICPNLFKVVDVSSGSSIIETK
jgi:hypothetical protein